MGSMIKIAIFGYILLFFISVIYSLKFQFSRENHNEQGEKILNISYRIAFPLVLLGWFVIDLIDSYILPFSLESYKTAIWLLVTGTFVVHAISLFILKNINTGKR